MRRLLRNSTWAALTLGNAWLASAQGPSAAALYKNGGAFGLRITIELKRDGALSMVNPQSEFHNGDQIRLHFTSNVDGYVYAVNETPSGGTNLLFPRPETGSDNMVRKDHDYTIPSTNGWFRMTGAAGVEKVLMIVSPRALPEVEAGLKKPDHILSAAATPPIPGPVRTPVHPASDSGGVTNSTAPPPAAALAAADPSDSGGAGESTNKAGVKNKGKPKGVMSTASQDVSQVRSGVSMVTGVASIPGSIRTIPGLGSRDLVFEDDLKQGSTYVSAKPEGLSGPTMFTIALVHR